MLAPLITEDAVSSPSSGCSWGTGADSLKVRIRKFLRNERRRVPPMVVEGFWGQSAAAAAAKLLDDSAKVDAVFLYIAREQEVPTGSVIAAARRRGIPILLPRRAASGSWLPARWAPGQPLRRDPIGLWEPFVELTRPTQGRVLAFVPVVAWDSCGGRLGRGAGAYDQVLGMLRDAGSLLAAIGLAYEFQRVEGLPQDDWDVPLNKVVTECRVVVCKWRQADEERKER